MISLNETIDFKKNLFHKHCSEEWYPLIDLNLSISKVSKGNLVFSEGDPVRGIYLINKGKIKIASGPKNNERILRLSGEGKLLGYRGIAAKIYPVSAIALTESIVTFLPNEVLAKLIKTNPGLSMYLIDFLAEELRDSEQRAKNLIEMDVKQRIASILLSIAASFGFDEEDSQRLSYSPSRKDFASLAGISYETVIRALFQLEKKKLIRLSGKTIYIPEPDSLQAFVNGN